MIKNGCIKMSAGNDQDWVNQDSTENYSHATPLAPGNADAIDSCFVELIPD